VQERLTRLARVLAIVSRTALWLAGTGLVLMTAIVAWQVYARYVLNASPSWTEAASILIMSWFIMLGAAVGVRENFHMGFDVLLYVLPDGARNWLRTISDLAVLTFGVGMVVYGMQLTVRTWTATVPVLQLPGGFTYMPVVAGGVLITLFALERLARRFAGLPVDREITAEDTIASEA
jgi:TRAP-type C4-dicarboxylate transport system permease small subunit